MSSAPFIRTGALKHHAELQGKSQLSDGGGGIAVSWVTERKIWCQIRPLSGTQRMEAMARQSEVSHEIYARYQSDVDPDVLTDKRIRFGASIYNINAAFLPEEFPEFVRMICERGVAT